MTIRDIQMTAEQFDLFAQAPENAERLLEFIAGEVFEVPSNPYVSFIAALILHALMSHVLQNRLGFVTGEAGGYQVGGDRYAPDVAFISFEKQSELPRSGYNPNPPDLAVEVISSDRAEERDQLRIKVSNYLAVGTIVWIVNPDDQHIEVHQAGQAVKIYRLKDTLDGGALLPHFQLKLADIFQNDQRTSAE